MEEANEGCSKCGHFGGCNLIMCPKCGYEQPKIPAWVEKLGKFFGKRPSLKVK